MQYPIRLRLYAPILWALWPFAAGLYLARTYAVGVSVGMGLGLLCLAVGSCVLAKVSRQKRTTSLAINLTVACGFLLLGLLWWPWRVPVPPEWMADAPPREATVILRVERVFGEGLHGDRLLGLARVELVPWYLEGIVGCGLYFSLRSPQSAEPIFVGSLYEARGLVRPVAIGDRGSFNHYLSANGYTLELVRGQFLDQVGAPSAFQKFCRSAYARLTIVLNAGSHHFPDTAGLLPAMLLGQKSFIKAEQESRLVQTGTMHLFAISGLHIVAVAEVLRRLFRWCRMPLRTGIVLMLSITAFYVVVTGGAPSGWRAFLMLLLFWIARTLWRQYGPLAAWSAAAMGVLLLDPLSLWHLGFQLSYLVVAGILLYGLPLHLWMEQKWPLFSFLPHADWSWREHIITRVRSFLLGALTISAAAFLASAPLIALYFGLFTPGGILLNLALVPAASLVVFFGVGSMLCAAVGAVGVAAVLNYPAQLLLTSMIGVIEQWAEVPLLFRSVDSTQHLVWKALLVANTVLIFMGPRLSRWGLAPWRWLLPWLLCCWTVVWWG